ncbi:hypothetical protein JCM31271_31420 [Halorubrum trueperi]
MKMENLSEIALRVHNRRATAGYDKPLPVIENEPYAKPFWDGATNEQLLFQQCETCGEKIFVRV